MSGSWFGHSRFVLSLIVNEENNFSCDRAWSVLLTRDDGPEAGLNKPGISVFFLLSLLLPPRVYQGRQFLYKHVA